MWFKLNTTFTQSLGTLSELSNSWSITRNLTNYTTTSTVTSVAKNGTYSATFTLNSGCTYSSHSVTMGGATVSSASTASATAYKYDSSTHTITFNNFKVTGALVITAVATGASSGGSGGGQPENPDENIEYILLDTDGNAKLAFYQALKLHSGDTQMYFTTDFPPASGYTNKGGSFLNQATWANTAKKYCCTIVFTPETLPVGSKVSIANGWMHRMNYWSSADSYGNRDASSAQDVIIDEAFWSNKAMVAFNISKGVNSEVASELTVNDRQLVANHEILTIIFA